jgi:protein-S-isoprenylcysteine O-methyltransferase Ste14
MNVWDTTGIAHETNEPVNLHLARYGMWLAVLIYLTIAAKGVKQDTSGSVGQRLGIMFGMIAAVGLPFLPVFRFLNFTPGLVVGSIGLTICITGWVFFVWARQNLGRNWSGNVSIQEGQELITSGPYRYLRHPMYSGGLVACIGSAIVVGGLFIFLLVILTPVFVWRTSTEDTLMEQQFPREYTAYKKRTKALIPFVW